MCCKYSEDENLKILHADKYLCRNCTVKNMEEKVEKLKKSVKETHKSKVDFVVYMVVITGILQWDYQIQILLSE